MSPPTPILYRIPRSSASTPFLTPCLLRQLAAHSQPTVPRFAFRGSATADAAILIPFVRLAAQSPSSPAVLFTLRSSKLRSHTGEISFPGGRLDPALDATNLISCAVRETIEEIGVPRSSIHVLADTPWSPVPNKDCSSRVYPVLACIDLPSASLDTAIVAGMGVESPHASFNVNPDEVDLVFTMTIDELVLDASRRRQVWFRGRGPWLYEWRVPESVERHIASLRGEESQSPRPVWIWGLTAYVLEHVLRWVLTPETLLRYLSSPRSHF